MHRRVYDPEQHLEHRRYDQSEYEPFRAAAEALDVPPSLHTATQRQGKIRGAGEKTLRDASSRATKAFYPAPCSPHIALRRCRVRRYNESSSTGFAEQAMCN